jgi:hypothetical protein
MNVCKIWTQERRFYDRPPGLSVFFSTQLSSARVPQPWGCQGDRAASPKAFDNISLLPRNGQAAVLPSSAAPVMSPTKAASHDSCNARDFYTFIEFRCDPPVVYEAGRQSRPNQAR